MRGRIVIRAGFNHPQIKELCVAVIDKKQGMPAIANEYPRAIMNSGCGHLILLLTFFSCESETVRQVGQEGDLSPCTQLPQLFKMQAFSGG